MSGSHPNANPGDFAREAPLSLAERDQRWARVREAMRAEDLAVLVTPPNTGFREELQAATMYLTTIGGNAFPASAVFPLDGEVTAVVGPVPSVGFWQSWQKWVTDVRGTSWNIPPVVIARLKELGVEGKRIGLVNLGGSVRFPEGSFGSVFLRQLEEAFPNSEFVDATRMLDVVRNSRSEEEVEAIRRSVEIVESAFELLLQEARPGVTEREVCAKITGHLLAQGAIPPHFHSMAVGNPFKNSLSPVATTRPMRAGEIINIEIEARCSTGYLGQITRTAVLGKPSDQLVEMFDKTRETIEAVANRLQPGNRIGDVLSVYDELQSGCPFKIAPVMHSRALGEDWPMIIYNTTDQEVLDFKVQPNQTFAVKAQVFDDEKTTLAFWGESMWARESGAVRLGKRPIELRQTFNS